MMYSASALYQHEDEMIDTGEDIEDCLFLTAGVPPAYLSVPSVITRRKAGTQTPNYTGFNEDVDKAIGFACLLAFSLILRVCWCFMF